jgi:hypothetical protein
MEVLVLFGKPTVISESPNEAVVQVDHKACLGSPHSMVK